MFSKVINVLIFVVCAFALTFTLIFLFKHNATPIKDTSATLIKDISAIDSNTTNRVNEAIEEVSRGRRGLYE